MKNPSNYPIKCFALIKKITSRTFIIAGALIVIMSLRPTYYTLQIHATFHNTSVYQCG